MKQKRSKTSRKCENIVKTMSFIAAIINCSKRTSGILCSDSAIFEVLLCHINNFSSFTVINVWREFDFFSHLFQFLSVRSQRIRSTVIMSQPITSLNGPIVAIFFCAKFSHFLRKIFAFSFYRKFCIFSLNRLKRNKRKFSHFWLTWINLLQDESGRVLGGKHASIQFAYDLNKVIVLILYKL